MRTIFTLHAGEYITADYIERNVSDSKGKKSNVWVPGKDSGIDILVTNNDNSKCCSLQVKYSKDMM